MRRKYFIRSIIWYTDRVNLKSLLPTKKFLYATTALAGTMIGVGIFGLPFAFAKAGFAVGIIFLIFVAALTLLVDLMYGEVVLRTEAKHQLVGYTKFYLGGGYQKIIFFAAVFTGYAALLAYIIIAGDFLNTIFARFFFSPLETYSVLFFSILTVFVFLGIKTVSWVELLVSGLLVLTVVLMVAFGARALQFDYFRSYNPEYWFLPYGVLLFAFAGLLAIPIQRQILHNQEEKIPRAVTSAVIGVGILYLLFAFFVVGVSGEGTTPDAISGLYEALGPNITLIGAVFGVFAVTTSFLMLGTGLLEIFHYDFKIHRIKAWALVVFPPLILYLLGIRTFVNVIGLAGAVALGIEGVILVLLYSKAKEYGNRVPEYSLNLPRWLLYLIMILFTAGVVYAFIN